MPTITSAGLGSGLDINNLVTQLVQAEREPVANRLDRREVEYQADISAFGALKSALSEFQTAVKGLQESSAFDATTVTSSNPDLFTATASGAPPTGGFSIEVHRLAEPEKLRTKGFSGSDAEVGTGTLTVALGSDSFDVAVDSSNNTLAGIRDAINNAADNPGVTATIVNVDDGSGGTESRLVLSSEEGAGTSKAITVTVADDDGNNTDAAGLSQLASDHLVQLQAAVDAEIRVDEQTITRDSNTISDAIEGITLTLVSADPEASARLTVGSDSSVASTSINDFVESFNKVVDTLNQLSSFNSETGEAGVLFGDATLRNAESQLRRIVGGQVTGLEGNFDSLASIGITTDEQGKLSVDNETLEGAIERDLDAVIQLFASENGVVSQLDSALSGYVSSGGLIADRVDGLNTRVERINDQRADLERRLQAVEERYRAQFTAMDALVGELQSTSNFLSQQFAALQSNFDEG